MYGSTCADMQVDVMGECLSSIKHVVGTTSGCFYPRTNHWEVGGRPQCDKCGCRVRIAHSIVSRLWRQFQTTGIAIRGFSRVVHEEPHPQMTGTLSYRPEETGGRQREKSLDTRHRRLDDRYRVLPWPEDCTVVVCLHDALYDESRFSLSSDSHRILIWRERGSRNHPSNIIERDRYGGCGVLVWGSIMLGSRTDLHIFDAGSVNGTRYCNEILLPYVRLFRGAMGLQFLFMDDNAPCHRTVAAEQFLESEDIERMDWPARSPDLNPIEHVWDFLGSRLTARTLPPVTIRELRLALQDEWAAMPQQLIDTLILSMGRRCETCLALNLDAEFGDYTSSGNLQKKKALRTIFGPVKDQGCWRTRYTFELYRLYKEPQVTQVIRSNRLRWLGHIWRSPENNQTTAYTFKNPIESRTRGRPPTRWIDDVEILANEKLI
ncbi:transposable element Tcb2 transposase [Trichonephila clavipes]|nr:transposable element Tcb2 transposase [Trichonephila clavipes]